jgi:hypothetical protein
MNTAEIMLMNVAKEKFSFRTADLSSPQSTKHLIFSMFTTINKTLNIFHVHARHWSLLSAPSFLT